MLLNDDAAQTRVKTAVPTRVWMRVSMRVSMRLSMRWAARSKRSFLEKGNLLFGIVQGGIYHDLRRSCAEALIAIGFPGYAVGGLAIGETPSQTDEILGAAILGPGVVDRLTLREQLDCFVDPRGHPLTEPAVRPAIMNRWPSM